VTKRDRHSMSVGRRVVLRNVAPGGGSGAPIADGPTRPHAGDPEPGPRLQKGHAPSPPKPRRRKAARWPARLAGVVLVAEIAKFWHAQPPSLHQVWSAHRHDADMWRRQEIITPPPPQQLYDEWGSPVATPGGKGKTQPPKPKPVLSPPNWMSRLRLAYGCPHLAGTAVCYFASWVLRGPVGALATAGGLVLLAVWHPW
jgi:hypothetical protein